MVGVTAGAVCLINIITLRVGRHGHLDRNQQVRLFVDFSELRLCALEAKREQAELE